MDGFQRGVRLFNEGRYLEAHEAWEKVWCSLPASPRRLFLQGMIMIATGLHKFGGKEYGGATKLFKRGIELLEKGREGAFGLEFEPFLRTAADFRDGLAAGTAIRETLAAFRIEPKPDRQDKIRD